MSRPREVNALLGAEANNPAKRMKAKAFKEANRGGIGRLRFGHYTA
jgi:hypothetical protein